MDVLAAAKKVGGLLIDRCCLVEAIIEIIGQQGHAGLFPGLAVGASKIPARLPMACDWAKAGSTATTATSVG